MKSVKRLSLVLLLCLAPLPNLCLALPVTGLYSHEIAVDNQSDQERNRAFTEALAAVIVKITGDSRWLEKASVVQALADAASYVEAIAYRTEARPLTPDPAAPAPDPITAPVPAPATYQQDLLNVSFARDLVDRLLTRAAIPVWDSNRPSVLVWMVLQNDAGERSLLSREADRGIMDLMRQFADRRGLPIIFPVLDFEDRRALAADTIWALDEQAIASASMRYAPDSILAGRLHFSAGGDLVGVWQFQFQDQIQVFDSLDTELASYINAALDRITIQLAGHFAVVPSASGGSTARLRVEGVATLAAYAELVTYLEGLVLVDGVTITNLEGNVLELSLSLQGSAGQLYELLSLDRNLTPLDSGGAENRQFLTYRWTR